jgi:ABC-2 type transport system permease protein
MEKMFNLIKADLYKSFHRQSLYIFTALMLCFALLVNVVFASVDQGISAVKASLELLTFPLLFLIIFVDIVTAEENKLHTSKNTISYGLSRIKFFIAKNITATVLGMIVGTITIVVYLGSALVLLQPEKIDYTMLFTDLLLRYAAAFLIYIAAITLGTFLACIIKQNSYFVLAYNGIILIPTLIFQLLSNKFSIFHIFDQLLLITQSAVIAEANYAQLMISVWISLAHIVIFMVLGLIAMKRQEIK